MFASIVAWAAPAPSTITLQISLNPSNLGQTVTLTATVSPAAATGAVTFYDGVDVLGIGHLSAGLSTDILTVARIDATFGAFRASR